MFKGDFTIQLQHQARISSARYVGAEKTYDIYAMRDTFSLRPGMSIQHVPNLLQASEQNFGYLDLLFRL